MNPINQRLPMRRRKLVWGTILSSIVILLVWGWKLQPLDGVYRGDALDGAAVKCSLHLDHGLASIVPDQSSPVPYGRYGQTKSGWTLCEEGATNAAWIILRHPMGFDLVAVTNQAIRYRFVRDYLGWVKGSK
jgi:hypothetical protein